jgi:hypothetical protein
VDERRAWIGSAPHGSVVAVATRIPEVRELSREEGHAHFDQRSRQLLGLSREEFLEQYLAGQLDPEDIRVAELEMMLPFAR